MPTLNPTEGQDTESGPREVHPFQTFKGDETPDTTSDFAPKVQKVDKRPPVNEPTSDVIKDGGKTQQMTISVDPASLEAVQKMLKFVGEAYKLVSDHLVNEHGIADAGELDVDDLVGVFNCTSHADCSLEDTEPRATATFIEKRDHRTPQTPEQVAQAASYRSHIEQNHTGHLSDYIGDPSELDDMLAEHFYKMHESMHEHSNPDHTHGAPAAQGEPNEPAQPLQDGGVVSGENLPAVGEQ